MSGSSAKGVREASAPPIVYRSAAPADREGVEAIDDSFTTDRIYEVVADGGGFALRERDVEPPLLKVFPAEDEEDEDGEDEDGEDEDGEEGADGADAVPGGAGERSGRPRVEVAVSGDAVCGFVEYGVEEWHSRLVVHRIAVAPAHRGRGIGAELMERACAHGRRAGARTAWLEVTNVNAPAVRAYRRMGFELCGLDTTFYRGTASEGETALFMSRELDNR
ncbi:GNAT family N-acetyltransferase [Streptomyces sp. NPDC051921]|uniref:GNAT family N-acetyltransferase n=1 Tax=Streptomyces sp. NPDC051921 TaxID=3155806 RepID=UPI00341F5F52